MHLEMIIPAVKWYIYSISQHSVSKFILGLVPWIMATIFWSHQELVNIVLVLYWIDFITWICNALKKRKYESKKFFKWAIKLSTYWILLIIAMWLDRTLHTWELMIWIMFTYIILTDSSSIIENLHSLWFNVPIFFIKYINLAQSKLEDKVCVILDVDRITTNNQQWIRIEKKLDTKSKNSKLEKQK